MNGRMAKRPRIDTETQEPEDTFYVQKGSKKMSSRATSVWAQVSVFLYCLMVFLLPLAFLPTLGTSLLTSKTLIIATLLAGAGFSYLYSQKLGQIKFPRTLFTYLGAFASLIVVSTLFSESFNASFVGGFQGGSFYALLLGIIAAGLGSLIISTPGRLLAFFVSFIAGVAVLGLIHVVRLIGGSDVLSFGFLATPTATLAGSWYDLGILFGVTYIVSLSGIVFGTLPPRLNILLTLLLFISVFFLIITHFNVLLIILSVFGVLVFLLSFRDGVHKGRALTFVTTVIFIVSVLFSSQINTQLGNIFNIEYLEVRPRWESTLDIVSKNIVNPKTLFLGNGPNTFMYLWQDDRSQDVVESDFWSLDFAFATSTFGTFILTLGIFAGILIVAWFGYFLLLTLGLRRDESVDPFTHMSIRASLLIALFIMVYGSVYVLGIVPFFLLCIFSGVAIGAYARLRQSRIGVLQLGTESGSYVFGTFAILFFVIGLHALALTTSSLLYNQVTTQAQEIESISVFDSMHSKLAVARFLDRNDKLERTKAELSLLEMQFLSNLDESQLTEDVQTRFVRAIERGSESAQTAISIDPRNYLNWITGGYVFETLGELGVENGYNQAASYYAQARTEYPTNPEIPLIQARLEQARGDGGAARVFIRESIEMKKSYINAYALLAQIELGANNESQALSILGEGVAANPRSRVLHYEIGIIHYRLKNFNRAVEALSKAIENDPNYANALYFRGIAHHTLGDKEASLKDLEKVLAMNESNQDLARVINNIRENRSPFLGVARGEGALLPEAGDVTTDTDNVLFSEEADEGGVVGPERGGEEAENIEGDEVGTQQEFPLEESENPESANPLTDETE
jgi:tetratricopeptide (TPR) repeat protein